MRAKDTYLSKREQQILELLHIHKELAASQLCQLLPRSPSNSTVRTLLRLMEEKGLVARRDHEGKGLYRASAESREAARHELSRIMETFFQSSLSQAVSALLDEKGDRLSSAELDELQAIIDRARREAGQ